MTVLAGLRRMGVTGRRNVESAGVRSDAGVIMFWVIPVMIGLLALAGLVLDGGNAIAARQHAADVAQQAARAGADALSPTSLHQAPPGAVVADPSEAQKAADAVLSGENVTGKSVAVNGNSVTVRVTVRQRTAILGEFGLASISGSASSVAIALHGTTTVGGG